MPPLVEARMKQKVTKQMTGRLMTQTASPFPLQKTSRRCRRHPRWRRCRPRKRCALQASASSTWRGEPDFDTPENIKQAAGRAMPAGTDQVHGDRRHARTATSDHRFLQREFGADYERRGSDGHVGRQAGHLQRGCDAGKSRRRSADWQNLTG